MLYGMIVNCQASSEGNEDVNAWLLVGWECSDGEVECESFYHQGYFRCFDWFYKLYNSL